MRTVSNSRGGGSSEIGGVLQQGEVTETVTLEDKKSVQEVGEVAAVLPPGERGGVPPGGERRACKRRTQHHVHRLTELLYRSAHCNSQPLILLF